MGRTFQSTLTLQSMAWGGPSQSTLTLRSAYGEDLVTPYSHSGRHGSASATTISVQAQSDWTRAGTEPTKNHFLMCIKITRGQAWNGAHQYFSGFFDAGTGLERSTSMASWYFSGLLDAFQTSIRYFLLGRDTSARLVRSNGSKGFQGTR